MARQWADAVKFTPTLGGTTDWTFSSAVTGYQSPTAAAMDATGATSYTYRAESADLTQWEDGVGTWNGTILTRTTVIYNSSGGTSKINFSTVPTVGIVVLNADIQNTQQSRTVLTSGSGTYTTKSGCKKILVRMRGVGGGGGGTATTGATAGGAGTATTFGTSLLTANGGGGGAATNLNAGGGAGGGGTASGGDLNITGCNGGGPDNGVAASVGGNGGVGDFGGSGQGGGAGTAGGVPPANTGGGGGGGGGGGTTVGSAAAGGAGGYLEKLIIGPLATYNYAFGTVGTAGTGTTAAGGAGALGYIIVEEFF